MRLDATPGFPPLKQRPDSKPSPHANPGGEGAEEKGLGDPVSAGGRPGKMATFALRALLLALPVLTTRGITCRLLPPPSWRALRARTRMHD